MAKKHINYDSWSKDELVKELKRIKETTYGLVWHRDVPQEKIDVLINPDARTPEEMFANEVAGKPFPVLKEVKDKEVVSNKDDQTHILIEGDNYHSLAVLNFTHQEAIDVIYIDPPYNTGNNDFIYTDNFKSGYVDKEDPFRHSKWLSFMEKRLKLAKSLLKSSGILVVSIDDNEVAQLKMLLDDPNFFGEKNFIAILPTVMNLKGNQDQFGFAGTHEYTLVYAKDKAQAQFNYFDLNEDELNKDWLEDEHGLYKVADNLRATGVNAPREKRPNLWYPIFVTKKGFIYTTDDNKPKSKSDDVVYPINPDGQELSWYWGKPTLSKNIHNLIIKKTQNGIQFYRKQRPKIGDLPTKKPKSFWYKPEYSTSTATTKLKEIFGTKKFNNPKPVPLIQDLLFISGPKDAIVLDFMAGSGTTGHAVLDLNKEDGGNRKFILCTNNENKIATDVCQPRLQKVMKGYKNNKGEKIDGLGGNLKYFTAYDFVESEPSDKNKHKLVNKCTEMLCIKEGIYDLVTETDYYKIFKSHDGRHLGIIFYEDAIDEYKKAIKKIDAQINTYVFSLGDDPHTAQFTDVADKVVLQAIPEIILKVYQEIFR
jgi:adenine-specific DNA-methyltransferase